jgi:hypothetical protein
MKAISQKITKALVKPIATNSGSGSLSMQCSPSGAYSFNLSQTQDGTYNWVLSQVDAGGNSSAEIPFEWTRDTSLPSTPTLLAPSSGLLSSNKNSITLSATCDSNFQPSPAIVHLEGDVNPAEVLSPAGLLDQTCTNGSVTFVISKSLDASYLFLITQENPNTGMNSGAASVIWNRDTQAPLAPSITSPSSNPYLSPGNLTLNGSCEPDASVHLSGSANQSISCPQNGSFSFMVPYSVDGTYDFNLSQTDLAQNASSSTSFRWLSSAQGLSPPSIVSPGASPFIGKSSPLSLVGTCTNGSIVHLTGDSTLNQTCSNGSFQFSVQPTSDGTRTYQLTQSLGTVTSSAISFTWTLDTTAPVASFLTKPAIVNLSGSAAFVFSSNEAGSNFECTIDGSSFSVCTTNLTLQSLSNGPHSISVRAIDKAGNTGSSATYTWTQSAYNTIALYHFASSNLLADSGGYTMASPLYNNNLTSQLTAPVSDTTGKLPQAGPSSAKWSSGYYQIPHNASMNLISSTMTVEGFIKLGAQLSTTGNYYTLISKTGSASPDFGWEVRLRRVKSSTYCLDFVGSLNGTSAGTLVSSSTFSISSTSTWNYFAVTWNKGTVNFYFGSTTATNRGTKNIGTIGSSALALNNAPLRLGANASSATNGTSRYWIGSMDEVRISQVVRPSITIPTAEFPKD